ncbi:hypothetical protein QQS21_000285 [Conoideocrella luteorostrata]|uniref:Uncharacterized protein n=1 Tax=Conoideocrella luteorostrata TaxID=1105319 RepID=A0AAJ0CZH4_9HYPO|nr:hypothetical protein QQS21_000285 [Conoideocrella luteorostrata]
MKTAFAHIAHGPTRTPSSKYVNLNEIKSWSDELSGVRPGRSIEDVEREAIDHLFNSGKQSQSRQPQPWSAFGNIRKYLHKTHPSKEVTPKDVLHATTSAGAQKPNTSSSHNKPSSLKSSELNKFDNPNTPRQPTSEEASKNYNDLDKYKPVEWNEPEGLPKLTSEERSKQYKDLEKYASPNVFSDVAAVESTQPQYDDLQKYKPVEWNEPDGLSKQTPEELSKNYNDLHEYGPVTWNEPDGLPKLTPEELSKNYDDLDKYGPVTWNEPDGLRILTPEEESKKYDDLDAYSKPFVAADSVLEAHELKQQDPTPKAEPLPAKVEVHMENTAKSYEDLDKYGPVKWNEPDGLPKLTPEELSKNYEDLHLYAQYPNNGPTTPRIHPEEVSKQYSDLRKYDSFPNAGPTEERVHPEVVSKQYKDLSKYPSAGYKEPGKIKHVHPEELTKNYGDLDKYQPQSFDSFDRAYPQHPEEAAKAYKDLASYKPVMHNEPDGKPAEKIDQVASSLRAYDGSKESDSEPRTATEIRTDVLRRAYRNSKHTVLQRVKFQQGREQERDANVKSKDDTPSRQGLTGSYIKDFPEEFATSWSKSNSWSKSTLFPKNLAEDHPPNPINPLGSEKEEADFSSMDESFPSETSKLQPALDRKTARRSSLSAMSRLERMQVEEDPYSKSPQGLELSYAKECGDTATWPTFIKHHKGRVQDEAFGADSTAEAPSEKQPVLYKMLAYDAGTQSISVAETSSGVHDASAAATPAEVLLRISNPSKFFPYFSALQAEGYELASGGGDVLVFRKVRSGSAFRDSSGSTINPIDMMGRSAASNFASPTGYVNYESPQYGAVAAGQGQEKQVGKKHKKRSLGRKVVIGTAWVAGSAYAVSVVGEYFSTGGKVF